MGQAIVFPHMPPLSAYTVQSIKENGILGTMYSDASIINYFYNYNDHNLDIGYASCESYGRTFIYAIRENKPISLYVTYRDIVDLVNLNSSNLMYDEATQLWYSVAHNTSHNTEFPEPFTTLREALEGIDAVLSNSPMGGVSIPVQWTYMGQTYETSFEIKVRS